MKRFLPNLALLEAHKKPKDRIKLAIGALLYPQQTRRWSEFLREHPQLQELADFYPPLRHKIYRPYLSTQLTCADRVNALIAHYDYLLAAGFGGFVSRAALQPITLCRFFGKSASLLKLQIAAVVGAHREGEFFLRLMKEDTCLFTATFLLNVRDGKRIVQMGSLQGIRSAEGADIMKMLTRELHGFRPKNFMVAIVREIGCHFGCHAVYLTGNANRICINESRRKRITADYDATWRDMHARPLANGDFEMPCSRFQPTDLESLASKKRSEARKRNELVQSICDVLHHRLERQRTGPIMRRPHAPLQFSLSTA